MATKGDISGLDELLFNGEYLVPMVSGFSRRRRTGIVQSNVQGGVTRQRKKFYNQPYVAQATYDLETDQAQDFIKLFFERNEGKYFIAHLSADRPIVEPYVVQVVSDWEDNYVSQIDGSMTVTLEIISVRDTALDDYLFTMYQSLGELSQYNDELKQVVLAMPEV